MIFITKTKHQKEYKMSEMPNFENIRAKVAWLRRQKMLTAIHNIKSVSVQVKDIKHMIYSKNPRLVSLYAKLRLSNNSRSYNEDDYITITKSTDLNKSLIYALISSDWLLDIEDVERKSTEELQQECMDLQNKINELKERKKQMINHCNVDYEIKLFEYKLFCLYEIVSSKIDLENNFGQSTIERVLLKDK